MSSGASPSMSNLYVTILLLWVSNWHSTILSPLLETYGRHAQLITQPGRMNYATNPHAYPIGYGPTHLQHAQLKLEGAFLRLLAGRSPLRLEFLELPIGQELQHLFSVWWSRSVGQMIMHYNSMLYRSKNGCEAIPCRNGCLLFTIPCVSARAWSI